ncbi:hypothetical protein CXB51_023946 [Gossypium anomalum]|uniref:Integrase catalytic domain-containing protein n=1 Tax=Gossypium anomalum TaxID=47600 RepID=A0A8J6CPD5_9ROSI|nr:hypothetical protein CXB51_023946 [Gossypium anomalum]
MTDRSRNLWLDSIATVHVCNDQQQFNSYELVANCEMVMGNYQSIKVLGQGMVELNFRSGKKLTLTNVLHVPDVRKNLVSASILCNKGFKIILESDKFALLKGDIYVGKGYCNEDDFSRFTYVYLMRSKDEAFDMFKHFKNEAENLFSKKIKVLRSDRGKYFSNEFNVLCEEQGVVHECFAPYTPQQNGLVERKNRTLANMVNSILLNVKLPYNLWGEALLTVCYILNIMPSKKFKVSPYELWKGRMPNLDYFKVWGCLAYYRVPDQQGTKLGPRAVKGAFDGYAQHFKAYHVLDLVPNTIIETRDVVFIENKDIKPRKSQRVRKVKDFGLDFISSQSLAFLVEGNRESVIRNILIILNVDGDP